MIGQFLKAYYYRPGLTIYHCDVIYRVHPGYVRGARYRVILSLFYV